MTGKAQQTNLKVLPVTIAAPIEKELEAFLLDCEARHLTPRTLHWYEENLRPWLVYLAKQGVTALRDITPTHIRSFYVHLQRAGLGDKTIHGRARALRAWLNWAVLEDLIDNSPMRKVKMPKTAKTILPALDIADVEDLLSACKTPRDTAVVLFLLDTGVRAAEFCALSIGDIDVKLGVVMVRSGKGRKDRAVFMSARARVVMLRYLRTRPGALAADPLWLNRTKRRMTLSGLRSILDRLAARAGVKGVTPHAFRRTFCLWAHREGMDLEEIRRILGHEDLTVIRQYLALDTQDLAAAHRRASPVDRVL